MIKNIFTYSLLFISAISFAQKNLVPNGSFDVVEKKIKAGGMIEMATGWTSPYDTKADLFSEDSKADEFLAPANKYGKEKPEDGTNYAGIMIWSYKNAKPTTFIQSKLSSPLVAGKTYCVKYLVSLADLAKYSTNNMGLHLSKEQVTSKMLDKFDIEPQIAHSLNKVMNEQYTWEAICRTYEAEGGENYVTIGNFKKPEETKAIKVKRPSGFTKPQQTIAYYYIENVSVIPMDSLRADECICEKDAAGGRMNVVKKTNVSEDNRMEHKTSIMNSKINFDYGSSELKPETKVILDEVVRLLKIQSHFKINIQGHTDEVEGDKEPPLLSEQRAQAVRKYLAAKGIPISRMVIIGVKSGQLLDKTGTSAGQAKNRRVQIKVL